MEVVETFSEVIDKDGETGVVEERNLGDVDNLTPCTTERLEAVDVDVNDALISENADVLEGLIAEETQHENDDIPIPLPSTNESDSTISEIANTDDDVNKDPIETMEVSETVENAEKDKAGSPTLLDDSLENMDENGDTCAQDKVTRDDENNANCSSTETTPVETSSIEYLIQSVEKINDNDSTSQDCNTNSENPVFVHVNAEKDDNEKSSANIEQDEPDVDPIGSSDWTQNIEGESRNGEEQDEAECIIPDTNRILTQEEKDSATNIRDPSDAEQPSNSSNSEVELPAESENPDWKGKYVVNICTGEFLKKCMICSNESKTKYTCTLGRKQTFICSEICLKQLKEENVDKIIIRDLRVKNFAPQEVDNLMPTYGDDSRHCTDCGMIIRNKENLLSWETLDYCSEACLTKYQKRIGSYCSNCNLEVSDNFLGKYCVRFGYNIRQFCSSSCLEEYKKGLKVCAYCQEDMSGNTSGFLASIGDKGMFRDFCSAVCMEKYNSISKNRKTQVKTAECCVCHKVKPIEIELEYKSKITTICSDPCFVAYKFVNNVSPEKCDMCAKHTLRQLLQQNSIVYDGQKRKFCSKTCQNIYITTHRKIVSCCWCKVKKYNFDMIQKATQTGDPLMICSLNCLSLYQVSISASKAKKKSCDNCHKVCKGQFHMTVGDTAVKNFCSYPCVTVYQSKYATEIRIGPSHKPTNPPSASQTLPKRMTRKTAIKAPRKQIIPDVPGPLPIITSVRSLATTAKQTSPGCLVRALRSKALTTVPSLAPLTNSFSTDLPAPPPLPPPIKNIIVIRPPDLPLQRNVATLVKPITIEISIEVKPLCFDKAVQTDDLKDCIEIVPIPVPIYVPSPVHMFSLPFAVPVPFPLPIPVPIFIPTTKNTAHGLFKEIKKSQVRTPTDPYEADLLMMAEMVAVAGEKKEENEESESEIDNEETTVPEEASFSPEPQDASNTFGDDMLQMALKMATDFEEPPVDLEGALTASTITATAGNEQTVEEQVDDPQPVQLLAEKTTFRGRRRGRPYRHGGRGRGRGRPPTQVQPPVLPSPEPTQPAEPVEKPDANMCLKYTFGVNAWKQWVTTKNAELEKTSRRVKLFKTEILQLTSDELNYSLCLFVKEVRKPNGAEYAPDTIYYLCLGIQQYLFENGRIDNIFCDSYYEKFTDCLDEVCKKFSSLYNDSQYIVTRVEEEHLWESKQLGAHSPHVLLSTLMFFNTKHFNLTTVDEHMQLSFSHIMKHWKRVPNQPGVAKSTGSRNILLRFYPPQSAIEGNMRKKKVYEQQENEENPLRCPVKLYEFYLSKCPESVKTRNDVFYLLPERSCVPDSPVWYSTTALGKDALEKMLHRVKMVKEINVALLAS